MNSENVGMPYAVEVLDRDEDHFQNKKKFMCQKALKIFNTLSVEDNKKRVSNYFEEYTPVEGRRLQLIPIVHPDRNRNVAYIVGASGSGKSVFSCDYIKEYHRIYPKRPVYVFSVFEKDKSLDCLKYIHRIRLNDEFINTALELKDFAESLCLFDDIDTIKHKDLKLKLKHILASCLELGRHENIDLIYISHLATKGDETRSILNESTSITFFPKTLPPAKAKYLLENYYGLDKEQIKRIKGLKKTTRGVTIIKTYPNVVLSDHESYILKEDD